LRVSDFEYDLPPELVAQVPPAERGTSRMLVLHRATGAVEHVSIADLPAFVQRGDLLVVNDTKVFPARLRGRRDPSGGEVECLLLERLDQECWSALVHPGQKLRPGSCVLFGEGRVQLRAEILERLFYGRRVIRLRSCGGLDVDQAIDVLGHVPLPPYIKRPEVDADRDRYQTLFARVRGSVAAPTAGLHFSTALLDALEESGVERTAITLHVGYGTFKPVRVSEVAAHTVDPESYDVPGPAAATVARVRRARGRILAVGTTTTRALESAVSGDGAGVKPGPGRTDLFIHPGHEFRVVDALLTNFHLPRSSLLMLVCAFGGLEAVLSAYREAVVRRYRFYSYGDCMLVL
jgi:S-adenosylmethionine:tRNA ribosyltransferase-isomerase